VTAVRRPARRLGFATVTLALALGCGRRAEDARDARAEEPVFEPSLDRALTEHSRFEREAGVESRRLQLERLESPRTLGSTEEELAPLGRRGRVRVRFRSASLNQALTFLAEAGGFSLVVDGELSGSVDAELRDVRAYDALVALAEAHGLEVARRRNVVVVRPRDARSTR